MNNNKESNSNSNFLSNSNSNSITNQFQNSQKAKTAIIIPKVKPNTQDDLKNNTINFDNVKAINIKTNANSNIKTSSSKLTSNSNPPILNSSYKNTPSLMP